MLSVNKIELDIEYNTDQIRGAIQLDDTSEDLSEYTFDLYRSNARTAGFERIINDMQELSFIDADVNVRNSSLKYYYNVVITNSATHATYTSDVYTPGNFIEDDYSFYLMSIYETQLEDVIDNRKMIFLKRKHSGLLCAACYDEIRKRSQLIECNTCYGTGYSGGYYAPYEILVGYMNSKGNQEEMSQTDVANKDTPISLWTLGSPEIQPNDVLVDSLNDRYIVMSVQKSTKNGFVFRQTIQAMLLPKSNQVYKVVI